MGDLKRLDAQYVSNTYARFDLAIVKGKGALCYDEEGKEYIDLSSGIAVNTFGFSDDVWKEAVIEQLNKVQHTSNLYFTEPCVELAEMLCTNTGMKKVFFSNSGAESNECAIKAARKYAADKKGADYYKIITLKNSFHGRTITTLAATGQDVFHEEFQPLTEGFIYVEPNDIVGLKDAVGEHKVAAIMIELIQGEGGVMCLDRAFVDEIANIAKEQDILFVIDEIQTGNGRTGKLFAYMNYGIEPDIVSTAKGLAGGLPLGATLFGEKTKETLSAGVHGSTFGGNPIACAGAISVLSRLDEAFLQKVDSKASFIRSRLSNAKGIKSVSGMGLMIGIDVDRDPTEIITECMEQGVLLIKAKHKLRLLPPLNIQQNELEKAIEIIKSVCAK